MDIHPCPPPASKPCPQVCPPDPCPPAPIPKPEMRGLHMKQTGRNIIKAIIFGIIGGQLYNFLIARPRKQAYHDYYSRTNFQEQAEEMARKGLFQSCPKGS